MITEKGNIELTIIQLDDRKQKLLDQLAKIEDCIETLKLVEFGESKPANRPAGPGPAPGIKARKSFKSARKNSNKHTSQYAGVERLKPNKSGQVKFKVSYWDGIHKKNIYLGTHESELIAAAAYQDHIGNKAKAAELRAQDKQQQADIAEQAENNPDRPLDGTDRRNLKRQGKTYYVCKHCGLEYQSKGQCAACGNFDMRKVSDE